MASKIGFKRLTIRILDKASATEGTNLFTVEGKTGKGATISAKINGLSTDPVKTYGSDVAYYSSRKGVGDVTVDFELLDIPENVLQKVLGYKDKDGLTLIGADTEAPYVSIMLETTLANGNVFAYGFFKGTFSMDEEEVKTLEGKSDGIPSEKFKFTALASDSTDYDGCYLAKVAGGTTGDLDKLKAAIGITGTGA